MADLLLWAVYLAWFCGRNGETLQGICSAPRSGYTLDYNDSIILQERIHFLGLCSTEIEAKDSGDYRCSPFVCLYLDEFQVASCNIKVEFFSGKAVLTTLAGTPAKAYYSCINDTEEASEWCSEGKIASVLLSKTSDDQGATVSGLYVVRILAKASCHLVTEPTNGEAPNLLFILLGLVCIIPVILVAYQCHKRWRERSAAVNTERNPSGSRTGNGTCDGQQPQSSPESHPLISTGTASNPQLSIHSPEHLHRPVSVNMQSDDPPSYSEAVRYLPARCATHIDSNEGTATVLPRTLTDRSPSPPPYPSNFV